MEGGLASAGAPGTDDLLGTNHKHECWVPFTIRSIGLRYHSSGPGGDWGADVTAAGLAGWILEKLRDWGDCDRDVERRFTKDELLSNIMLYWLTQTIHSSCGLYCEDNRSPLHFLKGDYVAVPGGIARFLKREGPLRPGRWVERRFNIEHWKSPMGAFPRAMKSRNCWWRISAGLSEL